MYGKELRRRVRHRAALVLPRLLARLPEGPGRMGCGALGLLGYALIGRDRRFARHNLGLVHPTWTRRRIEATSLAAFRHLGYNAFDFLRYPELSPGDRAALVSMTGPHALHAAQRAGRGAVVVTAHFGCWELLAAELARAGFPLLALARPLREARLDRALGRHRARMGVRTASTEDNPRKVVRHLRHGGFVGVLADQRVRHGGIEVTFLGQPTAMTSAPARLARAGRAPIVPVGIVRGSDHRHKVVVLEPIETGEDLAVTTQRVADALSRLIRRDEPQWMWIHPRWRPAEVKPARVPEPVARWTRS